MNCSIDNCVQFQLIHKKAQSISAQNKNPHILSHGGYKKIWREDNIRKEKIWAPPLRVKI